LLAALVSPVFAQAPSGSASGGSQFSLLPQTQFNYEDCKVELRNYDSNPDLIKTSKNDVLGCGIKTGRITFAMIPYFVTYITNFFLGMGGIISVLFIVIGGYHYVIGGLSEEKEKGKNTIKYALMGMGLSLLAWTIVTVLINAVTG